MSSLGRPLPVEAVMDSRKTNEETKVTARSSFPVGALPPGVEQGLLIPPQNRRNQQPRVTPRSNLTVLLEGEDTATEESSHLSQAAGQAAQTAQNVVALRDRQNYTEADTASGPDPSRSTTPPSQNIVRSAPSTTPTVRRDSTRAPPPDRIPTMFPPSLSSSLRALSGGETDPQRLDAEVRRCISSKELSMLGASAPLSTSPFSFVLHQRDIVEATLQQRLMDARRLMISNDRSLTPSPALHDQNSDCSDSSKQRAQQRELKNQIRTRRRAEHTKAVMNDLCEIVTDLFIAEAKLLKPASYGLDSSLQRDHVFNDVVAFVSDLPPRYALGVETPSEVLLHMRLTSAVRMDPSRAVVHISHLKDNVPEEETQRDHHVVTISCIDAHGLLEYITRLLSSGGSSVLDADVMLSSDGIVLDRFVVAMKGRLRLDKLSQSIEAYLADQTQGQLPQQSETDSDSPNSAKGQGRHQRSSSFHGQVPGPVYFHPPKQKQEASPQELQQEIDSAVPLTQVLEASTSSNALTTNIVPMRRNTPPGTVIHVGGNMPQSLMQPYLPAPNTSPSFISGTGGEVVGSDTTETDHATGDSTERRRRPLVSREAVNFLLPEDENREEHKQSLEALTALANAFDYSESSLESRTIPLIPFEELMLIETLGMGRVSTIYRAAWQKTSVDDSSKALTDVQMVALKVATVNQETGDTLHVDELRREADIAAMLKHSNVCDLVGVAADSECFCLAYEFCEGGSLLSLLSDTSRYYEYLPIALDIANGMAYLHARQVIHRDLKPSNVLLTRDHRAKISDFGMSVANRGQELTAETGTYRYMAPEVIRHESYSSNADVYSFGILLWQLITREVPFATMTPIQAAFSVAEGRRPEIPNSTPPRLREIIEACWDQDSHKRPSFTYIAMSLADYARMAFSPANVGAQTLQIANEMLATVEGNSTINVDFSTPVFGEYSDDRNPNYSNHSYNVGLELE